MRSTLVRVEHANPRLLAAAIGLGAIALGTEGHCQGRQCLHIGSIDTFYEWNGNALTPVLDLTF